MQYYPSVLAFTALEIAHSHVGRDAITVLFHCSLSTSRYSRITDIQNQVGGSAVQDFQAVLMGILISMFFDDKLSHLCFMMG